MIPADRFSNRVDDYVRARPGYPDAVVATLAERFEVRGKGRIAPRRTEDGQGEAGRIEMGDEVKEMPPGAAGGGLKNARDPQAAGTARQGWVDLLLCHAGRHVRNSLRKATQSRVRQAVRR